MKRDITIGEIVAADYRAAQVFKEETDAIPIMLLLNS